jgi:P4 family phage/plasmid primase-like protien
MLETKNALREQGEFDDSLNIFYKNNTPDPWLQSKIFFPKIFGKTLRRGDFSSRVKCPLCNDWQKTLVIFEDFWACEACRETGTGVIDFVGKAIKKFNIGKRNKPDVIAGHICRHAEEVSFDFFEKEKNTDSAGNADIFAKLLADSVEISSNEIIPLTDLGNAERLKSHFGDRLRFVTRWGRWIIWNGKFWGQDFSGSVNYFAGQTAKRIHAEAEDCSTLEEQKKINHHAIKSQSKRSIDAMVNLARHHLAIEPDQLDQDFMLFNCENGTLDLRTGELLPHKANNFITKNCGIEFDPEAKAPRWDKFLNEVMQGDFVMISYLKRIAGYAMTGSTNEQCIFVLLGDGRNGKSTFIEILKSVFNDYSQKARADSFLTGKTEGANNDIARLDGVRLCVASEIGSEKTLNEPLVKEMTGGDTVTARFLYKEYFSFKPQFKIILAVNDEPKINGKDLGIWRRIRLIDFGHTVPLDEIDNDLMEKLILEAPGILAWAVQGCSSWLEFGLEDPLAVLKSTEAFRTRSDSFEAFWKTCVEESEEDFPANKFYAEYEAWSHANKFEPLSINRFGREMTRRGHSSILVTINVKRTRVYPNIKIIGQGNFQLRTD